MMTIPMKFEEFEKYIKEIKSACDFDSGLHEFLHTSGAEGYICVPNCIETATDLLSLIFCDEDRWIDYYVYELNFGESYQPGMVERADGTEIPLETVEDLYKLLTEGVEGQSANSESK